MQSNYVIVGWDGKDTPFTHIIFDEEPRFQLYAFCYNGNYDGSVPGLKVINKQTEFKGETIYDIITALSAMDGPIGFVGMVDDDIGMKVSAINYMLSDAMANGYCAFSAALTHDSYYSHQRFLAQPGGTKRLVDWVEIMSPFYAWDVLKPCQDIIEGYRSCYGIDQFVVPMMQKLGNHSPMALYDCATMHHKRPVTSGDRTFSNGLNADQERRALRKACMAYVRRTRPDLVGSAWWFDWIAPWNGPLAFLLTRLTQPFHIMRRALRGLVARD